MMARLIALIALVWLLIGAAAVYQRGYFKTGSSNCARAGTVAATVVVGPLNYLGVNPKITCITPQPSK
jgi:membrane protein YdbS with pleckstrin-like domain